MKFVKLHQSGREVLVNVSNITDIYTLTNDKSALYLNFAIDKEQAYITVDETLEEIHEKVKGE